VAILTAYIAALLALFMSRRRRQGEA
jgi:hypothetical protein